MYYSDDLIDEVRSRNDIVDVISGYIRLEKKGSAYMGLCPFHNEKTPSFSVNGSRQMFHCFGCGVSGDVFTFLMKYENDTFPEAMRILAERAGMTLPQEEPDEAQKRERSLKQRLYAVNKDAATYYYYRLRSSEGKQALEYLKNRAMSEETIRKFGLGYSMKYRDDLYRYLRGKNYDDQLLKDSGLIRYDEKYGASDRFWNRVMFPIMDVNSRVIGFGGRVMEDVQKAPKYVNSPETILFDKSKNLYGLYLARRTQRPYLILCEGYMDVIAMHQGGFDCAVASLGTAFTAGQALLLKRYTSRILLAYDSDGAGVRAALRATRILRESGLPAQVISLSPYKDPDEFLKNSGAQAFEERILHAQNSFLFEVSAARQGYDFNDPAQKTAFFRQTAQMLTQFEEKTERENYIEAVAREYGISFSDLNDMVNRYGLKNSFGSAAAKEYETRNWSADGSEQSRVRLSPGDDTRNSQEQLKVPGPSSQKGGRRKQNQAVTAQKMLLTWIAEDPSLLEKLRESIQPEDFPDPLCRQTAKLVYDQYDQEHTVAPVRILNAFDELSDRQEVASMFEAAIPDRSDLTRTETALNESIKIILDARLLQLRSQIHDADSFQELASLQKRIQKTKIKL